MAGWPDGQVGRDISILIPILDAESSLSFTLRVDADADVDVDVGCQWVSVCTPLDWTGLGWTGLDGFGLPGFDMGWVSDRDLS